MTIEPIGADGAGAVLEIDLGREVAPSPSFDGLLRDSASAIFSGPHGGPETHDHSDKAVLFREVDDTALEEVKDGFVSEAHAPGEENKQSGASDTTSVDQLADRANQLYTEITVYHVAWGIATRMQKDISHLLKGM